MRSNLDSQISPRVLTDQTYQRRSHRLTVMRTLGALALAAIVVMLPTAVSVQRRILVIVAVVLMLTLEHFLARRLGTTDPSTMRNGSAAFTCALWAVLIPTSWAGAVVVYAVMLVVTTWAGDKQLLRLPFLLGALLLGFAAWYHQPPNWQLTAAMGVVSVLGVLEYNRQWNASRREVDRRYQQLSEHSTAFFWEVDRELLEVVDVNGDPEGVMGWSRDEAVGRGLEAFLVDSRDADVARRMRPGDTVDEILPLRHRAGNVIQTHSRLVATEDGRILGSSRDVTDIVDAKSLIQWQSTHDELTGLHNRPSLQAEIDRRVALEQDSRATVALILVDLNRFGDITETLSHRFGDRVLQTLSARYRNLSRDAFVARTGGDEFAFLVHGEHLNVTQLQSFADKLATTTSQPVTLDGLSVTCGAAIGIAICNGESRADELLRQAQIAIGDAKKNQTTSAFYSPEQQRFSVERLGLASELAEALTSGQIELWVQPKVDAQTGMIVGGEGLARWRHPQHGVLAPGSFVDLVEISDVSRAFAAHVLSEGVRIAARCRTVSPDFQMSINMTPHDINEPSFGRRVVQLLREHDLPAVALTIEITEQDVVHNWPQFQANCLSLSRLGINFSIDDFGTGWSSLTRLHDTPVNELKIDRSFISRLDRPGDRSIVGSVIELSENLGVRCVAEGVEEQAEADILRSLGCAVLQGYHFGRPVTEEEFLRTHLGVPAPALRHEPTCH